MPLKGNYPAPPRGLLALTHLIWSQFLVTKGPAARCTCGCSFFIAVLGVIFCDVPAGFPGDPLPQRCDCPVEKQFIDRLAQIWKIPFSWGYLGSLHWPFLRTSSKLWIALQALESIAVRASPFSSFGPAHVSFFSWLFTGHCPSLRGSPQGNRHQPSAAVGCCRRLQSAAVGFIGCCGLLPPHVPLLLGL